MGPFGGSQTRPGAGARRPRRGTSIGSVSAPSSPEPAGPGRDLPSAAPAADSTEAGLSPEAALSPEATVSAEAQVSQEAGFPDAGSPDSFGRLWTPHRMAYIKGEGKPTGPGAHEGCPFCIAPTLSDEEGLIVARGELVYAIMNLYPYNSGHMLICPYRHLADYTELTREETAEFSDYTTRAITALRTVSGPHGFNIGMNLGTVAGAGIAAHLHQHVVPRWGGDTNFMPVVGRTRVLPQLLADTRKLLADAWPQQ
jgi:ATP adenylyltransferase